MRIFISSTCYDLIDLRFELSEFLSDDLDSDFRVKPGENSIQTCLENVRSCDAFIIILSSRYGPTLEKYGYADLSATHLEYLEAIKCGIPVRMYVRDRLEADYVIWKKNQRRKNLKLAWVPKGNFRIFELLEAHRTQVELKSGNWLWTFRNSTELKRRLTKDFADAFARVMANSLFKAGRIPLFEIGAVPGKIESGSRPYHINFRNLSEVAAIEPVFQVRRETDPRPLPSIDGNSFHVMDFAWVVEPGDILLEWTLTYSILEGHKFEDTGVMIIQNSSDRPRVKITRSSRRYIGVASNVLLDQNVEKS
jgi:hypothetical protein